MDEVNNQLRMKLENAYFENHKPDGRIEMAFAEKAEPLLIDLKNTKRNNKRSGAMTNAELHEEIATNHELSAEKKVLYRSEITRRYSFSMACLAFAFIAVPLGLGSRRRDTSGGLIISLLIGTGYFALTILADQFKTDLSVTTILWLPNVACVLLGLWLFRRARFK